MLLKTGLRFLETINSCDAEIRPVLGKLYDLHVASLLEKSLAWFLISGLLDNSQVHFLGIQGPILRLLNLQL
jgi:hypothetical protein